jgi:hypothetical protein
MFSLLKPTVSLVLRPYVLTLVLRPTTQRSPTDCLRNPTISVMCLAPDIFGAESLDQ